MPTAINYDSLGPPIVNGTPLATPAVQTNQATPTIDYDSLGPPIINGTPIAPQSNNQQAQSGPILPDTPTYLDDNGNPKALVSEAQNTIDNPGNQTLDEPSTRYETALATNPHQAATYLNTHDNTVPNSDTKRQFAVNSNNDIVYSDDGTNWNRYETTFPNSFNADSILSSLAQKVPGATEGAGMLGGAALGSVIGGPLVGGPVGAAVGGGGANLLNQYLGNSLGVAPINGDYKGVAEQAGEHAAFDGLSDLGGRLLIPPLLAGGGALFTGNDVAPAAREAFSNVINGVERPAINPNNVPLLNKLGLDNGSFTDTAMRNSNQKTIANGLLNKLGSLNDTSSDFVPKLDNSTPGNMNQNLRQAILADSDNAKIYFNGKYDELKNGVAEGQDGNMLSSGTPGLNSLPADKSSIISNLTNLKPRTPEGVSALSGVMDDINSGSVNNLGDMFELKKNLSLKPVSSAVPNYSMINSDYTNIGKTIENSFKDQIPEGPLKDAYTQTQLENSNYQNTLKKIVSKLPKTKSGMTTATTIQNNVGDLLDNLEKSNVNNLMPNTLNLYKGYLGNQLKSNISDNGILDVGKLNSVLNNTNGLNKADYLQRLLPIEDNSGNGKEISDQIQNLRGLGKNPSLLPSRNTPYGFWNQVKQIPKNIIKDPIAQMTYNPSASAAKLLFAKLQSEYNSRK